MHTYGNFFFKVFLFCLSVRLGSFQKAIIMKYIDPGVGKADDLHPVARTAAPQTNYDMTEDRLIQLNGYITYIYYARHISYDYAGRYIKAVQKFLENGTEINKKGYNKYVRENSSELVNEPVSKHALLDFLDYIGAGYNRKKEKSEIKSLEKLSTISEKNKTLALRKAER